LISNSATLRDKFFGTVYSITFANVSKLSFLKFIAYNIEFAYFLGSGGGPIEAVAQGFGSGL
jgi:hypothetical protein